MTSIAVDAVIEEARRRARRRRFAFALGALLLLFIGGGISAALELTGGEAPAPAAPAPPPGFHAVQARGPVQHRVVETRTLPQPVSVDLATRATRPVRTTVEVWWDRRGGLARTVRLADGRVQTEDVEPCKAPCAPSFVFKAYWPVNPKHYVREGRGTFHGQDVIWLGERQPGGFAPYRGEGPRVALDAHTHDPLAARTYYQGKIVSEAWLAERKPDVAPGQFWFVVPDRGLGEPLAYSPTADFQAVAANPFAVRARRALGRRPLWLGERYLGHRLHVVTIGSRAMQSPSGARLRPTNFVLYDYGAVRVEEFPSKGPYGYEQGPPAGRMVLEQDVGYTLGAPPGSLKIGIGETRAILSRSGLIIVVSAPDPKRFSIHRVEAVALAKALRAVPIS